MPDTYKVTQIFGQTSVLQRQSGWSETWYMQANEQTVIDRADALSKRRTGFLTRAASINATRIQLVGGRAKLLRTVYVGVLGADQDIPQMALSAKVAGQGVTNQKPFQIRGIPDGNVTGGEFAPTQGFLNSFNAYGDSLFAGSWRFKGVDLSAPAVDIVSISDAGVFQLSAPLTFDVGSFITLLRCRNTEGVSVRGNFYVSVKVNAQNGTFLGWTGGTVNLKGKARVRSVIYPLVAKDSLESIQITTRKVGRPFNLYHGRARKR